MYFEIDKSGEEGIEEINPIVPKRFQVFAMSPLVQWSNSNKVNTWTTIFPVIRLRE